MEQGQKKRITLQKPGGRQEVLAKQGKCWVSPDGRYAVAEIEAQEFAIGRVVKNTPEACTLALLERYHCPAHDEACCTLFSTNVEWSWMQYGFFKIVSTNWDDMTDTVHRFYFDDARYARECARLHPPSSPR